MRSICEILFFEVNGGRRCMHVDARCQILGNIFFFKKSISPLLIKLQTSDWAWMIANFLGYLWAKDGLCSPSSSGATACRIWKKGRFLCVFVVFTSSTTRSSWGIRALPFLWTLVFFDFFGVIFFLKYFKFCF